MGTSEKVQAVWSQRERLERLLHTGGDPLRFAAATVRQAQQQAEVARRVMAERLARR